MSCQQGQVLLVIGGARSGKSSFAERLAASGRTDPASGILEIAYVATAKRSDAEMDARIRRHVQDRDSNANVPSGLKGDHIKWSTTECPVALSQLNLPASASVVLVDCLTVWLSNWMGSLGWPKDETIDEEAVAYADKVDFTARKEIGSFLDKLTAEGRSVILVANEVGMGICPTGKISRYYRDTLGRINQDIGRRADTRSVYWMVAGFAVDVKKLDAEATL
ncbi:Cobinamide kinase/cobinamide phosphate guanyltransferase [Chytriomyces sp. MP71]|nr:Cobinamide kinase/cobinamide phosphate guanyltransferase [Chytriomyces sp. MP71]